MKILNLLHHVMLSKALSQQLKMYLYDRNCNSSYVVIDHDSALLLVS